MVNTAEHIFYFLHLQYLGQPARKPGGRNEISGIAIPPPLQPHILKKSLHPAEYPGLGGGRHPYFGQESQETVDIFFRYTFR
ncbi:hypothetical protein D9M69_637250 [compost metagenome]